MATDVLHVTIDTQQPRIVGDRLAQVISGKQWEIPSSSNAGVDKVTFTGMLTPLPYTPEWLTTVTGNYARLRKSQLSIASSSSWAEYSRPPLDGNYYVHSKNSNVKVYTLASYPRNRAMWLSWMNYNSGNEVIPMMECGWGEGTDAEVSLLFWSDGAVDITKNGTFLTSSQINEVSIYETALGAQKLSSVKTRRMMANEIVDVCLIPCRRGELLVLSNMGGGFNYFFEDIDPDDPDPTITGAGQFWFYVAEGQATVQVAPLKFKTSGYLLSPTLTFRDAPGSTETATNVVNYDTPGYGTQSAAVSLVEDDGVTTFVPDGILKTARIRVDLTGDGDSTAFVYSASSAFDALTATLPGDGVDLDPYWMELTLDVPDDPEQVQATVLVKTPATIEAAGATNLTTQGNRDIEIALGDLTFFIGRSGDPEWEEEPDDKNRRITLECKDRMQVLMNYRIQDPEPLDGLNISDAIAFLVKMAGFTDDDLDIGAIDYTLPTLAKSSDGEFALLPEVGDTPAQWIRKLWEEFAQKCFYGWKPTSDGVKFGFKTPEQLGTESLITLYQTDAEAYADGRPHGDYKKWITFSKPRYLVPEANDIYVVGRHPKTQRPIYSHHRDNYSIDPTVDPLLRPDNWIGELRQFGYVDPYLTSQADTDWVMGQFAEILPVRRELREVKCQFLVNPADGVPLWRGDCLTIKNRGVYRIRTLSLTADLEYAHVSDATQDRIWRETTYALERIADEP